MKRASSPFILGVLVAGVTGCIHSPPKADSTADFTPPRLTECVAEVVRVEKEEWTIWAHPGGVIARGNYVLSFRYREPAEKAAQVRVMCAYNEEELRVDGKILTPGDVIRFLADEAVLEQRVEPDVFSNVREPHLVRPEDTEANKRVEATSGTRPEI